MLFRLQLGDCEITILYDQENHIYSFQAQISFDIFSLHFSSLTSGANYIITYFEIFGKQLSCEQYNLLHMDAPDISSKKICFFQSNIDTKPFNNYYKGSKHEDLFFQSNNDTKPFEKYYKGSKLTNTIQIPLTLLE